MTSVRNAEADAEAARARLTRTLHALQDRLNPRTVAREAAETLVERGGDAARVSADAIRANPAKAAGAAALLAAVLARHRIAAAFRRRKRNHAAHQAFEPGNWPVHTPTKIKD